MFVTCHCCETSYIILMFSCALKCNKSNLNHGGGGGGGDDNDDMMKVMTMVVMMIMTTTTSYTELITTVCEPHFEKLLQLE